jgi:hypothetical protein
MDGVPGASVVDRRALRYDDQGVVRVARRGPAPARKKPARQPWLVKPVRQRPDSGPLRSLNFDWGKHLLVYGLYGPSPQPRGLRYLDDSTIKGANRLFGYSGTRSRSSSRRTGSARSGRSVVCKSVCSMVW